MAALITEALGRDSLSIDQLVRAIEENTGEKPHRDTVEKTLKRSRQFTQTTTTRPETWANTALGNSHGA